MAVSYNFAGPRIVRDGLVLYLDAGNPNSYNFSTPNIWRDISKRGNNGTLTNGPTFSSANGGSIVFDGSNDFVQCLGSFTVTAATFVTWIRRNGNQGTYGGILLSRGTTTTGMNFFSSNQLGYHWNDAGNTYGWNSSLTVPDLTWCMCAISITSSSATAYLCQSSGLTTTTNSVSHTSTILDDIKIGQDDFGGRFFTGNIAQAQIYNRALSQAEITQNFNATRGRFGV
jgi:hypothetical protein